MLPYRIAVTAALVLVTREVQAQLPSVVDYRRQSSPPRRLIVEQPCRDAYGRPGAPLLDGLFAVTGAARAVNGRVFAVSRGTVELIVFHPDGRVLARTGRRGQGPGEFSGGRLDVFAYRGDSIAVYDVGVRQVSIFDTDGRFARRITLAPVTDTIPGFSAIQLAGVSRRDGWFAGSFSKRGEESSRNGRDVARDSVVIVRFDPLGKQRGSRIVTEEAALGTDARASATDAASGQPRVTRRLVAAAPISRLTSPPFALSQSTVAFSGGYSYHIDERADALVMYDSLGGTARRVLLPPVPARYRPAEDGSSVVPIGDAQLLEVRSDADGRAWVELTRDSVGAARRWWLIEPSGRLVAEVIGPSGRQRVYEVGADYVLVRVRDADGLDVVAYCRLVSE